MTSTSRPDRPHTAPHALRREIPSTAAVLADAQDFAAMRRYRTFPFDDHHSYLQQLESLLHTLADEGVLTTLTLFNPAAYQAFCADLGLDPDHPGSRSRYTAEAAATGATLPYTGEPLADLLPRLIEETDRQETWEHASALLARAGTCTDCGTDLGHTAFTHATHALRQLLEGLGAGTHQLVCSIPVAEPPLLAILHTTADTTGHLQLSESSAVVFCTVLAAGLALLSPGGIVSRTTTDTAPPAAPQDTVRGWTLREGWLHPLTAAQVFTAYCTDAETGDPVPPEPGVHHAAGLPLTPPPDTHRPHPRP